MKNPIFFKSLKSLFLALAFTLPTLQSFAQTSPSIATPIANGPALFKKIHDLRLRVQPKNAEQYGMISMLNSANPDCQDFELVQLFFLNQSVITLHVWVRPADAAAFREKLGTPTDFPQMWIRYQAGNLIEVGSSGLQYPSEFGIDSKLYPHFVYDVAAQTVRLP
jgi:hypothetical protein